MELPNRSPSSTSPANGFMRLDGRTAIVTGAGSGIGQSIAILFARQGAQVIAVDLRPESNAETVAKVTAQGGSIVAMACDIGSGEQVAALFSEIDRLGRRIDILANVAGISHIGNILNTDEAAFDRVFQVNVKGMYLCLKAAVERMVKQTPSGGVILNMASIASLVGLEDRFAYSMSKGAVLTMTRSVAVDHMKQGIRCNCICPTRIHTPFVDGFLAKNYPGREAEMFQKLSEYQPIGRMGKPEEVAAMALYLASDEAAFITGQAFPLDGGVLVS